MGWRVELINIKCYKCTHSALTILALNEETGLVIRAGEGFQLDRVYFKFRPFKDKSEWVQLSEEETEQMYERYLQSERWWGTETEHRKDEH